MNTCKSTMITLTPDEVCSLISAREVLSDITTEMIKHNTYTYYGIDTHCNSQVLHNMITLLDDITHGRFVLCDEAQVNEDGDL